MRPTREWAMTAPHEGGCRQVVMTEVVWAWFIDYVYAVGLTVFPIPVGDPDDLPTYGVGPGEDDLT